MSSSEPIGPAGSTGGAAGGASERAAAWPLEEHGWQCPELWTTAGRAALETVLQLPLRQGSWWCGDGRGWAYLVPSLGGRRGSRASGAPGLGPAGEEASAQPGACLPPHLSLSLSSAQRAMAPRSPSYILCSMPQKTSLFSRFNPEALQIDAKLLSTHLHPDTGAP